MFPPDTPRPINTAEAWKDEFETCSKWDRPPRKFFTDRPFYPWMPREPPQCRVSFKLGFQ